MTSDQIVQELQDSLAKAEASTAGKWKYERGEGIVAFTKDADKQFIADAHNNGPRHQRMLLAAIKTALQTTSEPYHGDLFAVGASAMAKSVLQAIRVAN